MTKFIGGHDSIDIVIELVFTVQQERSRWRIITAISLDVKGTFDCIIHQAVPHTLVEILPGP